MSKFYQWEENAQAREQTHLAINMTEKLESDLLNFMPLCVSLYYRDISE